MLPEALRRAHYRWIRPLPDRLAHAVEVLRHGHPRTPALDVARIANALPNLGGVPYSAPAEDTRHLIDRMSGRRGENRHQGIPGFEGFAPDDAVYDERTEQWRIWSYSRLARFLARFARARGAASVLELGSGAGQLFEFLRAYGVADYLGIDGSPLLAMNRICRESPQHFRTLNLQEELRLELGGAPVRFDVVCSFEVLEHIREDAIDRLIATIRAHMHARSTAFLTASRLECDVHVLVRPRDWWLARFAAHGLARPAGADALERALGAHHPHIWNEKSSHCFALEAVR